MGQGHGKLKSIVSIIATFLFYFYFLFIYFSTDRTLRVVPKVHMLQGNVDISVRVKGSNGTHSSISNCIFLYSIRLQILGEGTLYFTSVRKAKGEPFTICESNNTKATRLREMPRSFLPQCDSKLSQITGGH